MEDIINPIENEDYGNFEPLIQLNENQDITEFQFEEVDHKEIEFQRNEIIKKSQKFPFKVICDSNLPEA